MADTSKSEILVHPAGWEKAAESERLSLSNMGHIMPKIYVLIAEVFALPDDADRDAIIQSIVAGLEFTLSQYPVLVGGLEMDASTGRMWVSKKRASTARLHVKKMLSADEFPSFAELDEKDFPACDIAGHLLLPESVTAKQLFSPLGDNNENGIPVAAFQLNFIRGGLIIATAVHHVVSDGPGCDGFLTTWAQNSKAARHGQPFVPIEPFAFAGSPLDVADPSPERMAELVAAYPVLKDAGGPSPPPPPGFQMPAIKQQMYHFSRSKAAQLKAAASPKGGSSNDSWISTYDAIVALLWASISRARLPVFQPADMDRKAIVVHALNTRRIFDPPLPPRLLGVGSAPARTEPLSLREIVDPQNLPLLAAAMRASIRATGNPAYITGMLQWVAGHADRRWLEVDVKSFFDMDLGASSWQAMSSYTDHDFGFGLPSALRFPSPMFDGFVFLYPSRAAAKGPAADEGVELCVCLEANCQDLLLKDEILLQYAEPRG